MPSLNALVCSTKVQQPSRYRAVASKSLRTAHLPKRPPVTALPVVRIELEQAHYRQATGLTEAG